MSTVDRGGFGGYNRRQRMLSVVFKGGITMERKNAWTTYDEKDLQALEDVSKGYRA